MPLPFIAGLALGSVVMLGFTKREAIKKELSSGAKRAKELAKAGIKHSKAKYEELKDEVKKRVDGESKREKAPSKSSSEKKSRKPRAKRVQKPIAQPARQSAKQPSESLS